MTIYLKHEDLKRQQLLATYLSIDEWQIRKGMRLAVQAIGSEIEVALLQLAEGELERFEKTRTIKCDPRSDDYECEELDPEEKAREIISGIRLTSFVKELEEIVY